MMRDWGQEKSSTIYADSSAALAIAKRKGAGKLRHIHISALWVQDIQDRERTTFKKIDGSSNPADLMTKSLARDVINNHTMKSGQDVRESRAKKGVEMLGSAASPPRQEDMTVNVASASKYRPANYGI